MPKVHISIKQDRLIEQFFQSRILKIDKAQCLQVQLQIIPKKQIGLYSQLITLNVMIIRYKMSTIN